MSSYPNGQYYAGQPGQYGQSHYTISNNSQPQQDAFGTSDDSNTFAQSHTQSQTQAQSPPLSQYHGHNQPARAAQSAYGAQMNLPYRSQSQMGGYQHAAYNPAQYQTQSQNSYSQQTYATPTSASYPSQGYTSGLPTYVPAAYSDQTTPTYSNAYASSSTTPGGYTHRPQLPQSAATYSNDASYAYPHPGGQHLDMPTPPAPAPPPHHDSSITTRSYSHSGSTYDAYANSHAPSFQSSDIDRNHSAASRSSAASARYPSSTQPSSIDLPSRNPSQLGQGFGGRHPQGSTLPGLPSESDSDTDRYAPPGSGYSDLMSSLDAAIGTSSHQYTRGGGADPLFAPASPQLALSPDEKPTHNGILSSGDHNINYAAFANDSDAEAAAGIAAMRAMDEQEAEETRRRSSQFQSPGGSYPSAQERSDESDYANYGDLSLAGGGYAGTMHYGNEAPAVTTTTHGYDHQQLNPRMSSMRSSGVSSDGRSSGYDYTDSSQAFPTLHPDIVRVDEGGTGGLADPSAHHRRLSYEDNDEKALSDYGDGDGIPDLFFHPGMSPNRPLPPPPARSISDASSRPSQYLSAQPAQRSSYAGYSQQSDSLRLYPTAPDAYNNDALSPSMVPRSTSLISNRSQPRLEQPMRSKTDAVRKQMANKAFHDPMTPKSDIGSLDLPAIPRKKFDATKISSATFDRCTEPWALSSVLSWIKSLTEEETDLKENTISDAISALFAHKVPTISSIEAESLAQQFVEDMLSGDVLIKDEEWVKFGAGSMSGVMYQLTGLGCYSTLLHSQEASKARCYSHLCMRTVKKADFVIPDTVKEVEWYVYWNLNKEQVESRGNKERDRQFNMREMVYAEDAFLYGLQVLRRLYRDRLARADVTVISAKKVPTFIDDVFGLADSVRKVNEEYLAPQLKYRENEQGPWVVGYSDILREWIRRARPIYVEYAGRYPKADMMVRDEALRNPAFAAFLDSARKEGSSNRLGWDNYLKSPIQRLQRLILQLETILKNTIQASDEKTNLAFAIDEIRVCAHEMDNKLNEMNKTMELAVLSKKLRLRKHPGDEVDLALDHLGRTVVLKGDMMRQGGKGIAWVPCHAILFDHYLVLSKPGKDSHANEVFDVSKPPIPMVLISLESTSDPAVTKSKVGGATQVTGQGGKSGDPRLARATSNQSGTTLQHTNTGLTGGSGGTGTGSIMTNTNLESDSKEDKIYYPFKVKHLGRTEVYTLYATSAERRQEWCEAIISAKTQHAEALHSQNAEPFKLRVLADTAFGVEGLSLAPRRIAIKGTPVDRAVREVDKRYAGAGRPAPICRTSVNCATVFQQPPGRLMCAIGTDSGVYISEYQNPRGWVRSIQMVKVTQIAVLEEFNLLILLSDKQLIAYHLDVVCPNSGPPVPQADASVRKAPQKLSGKTDVAFFLAGKMKDRVLVFYQKRDGINSIFKILEPVLQKSATSKSRWLGNSSRRGQTEFFREYDEFYIPAETYGLNMFQTSLAVATKRGLEVLTLDKKITWGVPNLEGDSRESQAHLDTIAAKLKDMRPLGMFRLSEAEFIVAFSECGVYVNKLGDVSRSVTMDFVGRANNACLFYPYLILFNDDFVEIRDAQNGRLKQVIAGKDIRMLDDGGNATPGIAGGPSSLGGAGGSQGVPRTVKLAMVHPEYEKSYVVVEMVMRGEQR